MVVLYFTLSEHDSVSYRLIGMSMTKCTMSMHVMKCPQPRSRACGLLWVMLVSLLIYEHCKQPHHALHRLHSYIPLGPIFLNHWFQYTQFLLVSAPMHSFSCIRIIRENIYYSQFNNPSFLQVVFCLHRNYDLSRVWFMSRNLAAPYHSMCSLVFIKYSRGYIRLYNNSTARRCIDAAVTI